MASKIVRTIDIQYTAKGLEEIAAQANKISLFPVDSDNINEIQKRITSMQSILTSEGTIVSPELAEEIGKEYKAILDLLAKARLDLIGLEDKEAASSLDNVEAALSLIDDKIEKQEDRIEKMKISESDGWFTAEGKGFSKEVTQQASKQALTEGETMRGISGREIKNADSFLESMQKADEAMKSMNGVQTEIAEKLKAGKDLTKTELILVQEHLNTQENIKLNAEELSQQYKYRNSIIGQEQIILKDIYNTTVETAQTEIKKLQEQKAGLEEIRQLIESGVSDIKIISPEQQKILDLINETLVITNKRIAEYKGKTKDAKKEQREFEKAAGDATDKTKKQGDTLGKAAKQVFNYGIAFTALRRIYRETLRTITELDKAFTEMAVVTTLSRKQTWELSDAMFGLAKQTGFTATEIAKLATQYFRQGRSLKDVLTLTEVTAKAARIAGISTAESVTYLTSAVNGFGLAADQALAVSDRFAALAASSATSYEELANGLSKFAAQAKVAGLSIDFAMGMLAKGVETTREAPETIGTAIKTILARMRELTDYGKTLEEGMDVNRVERALGQVGIRLRDANGQFRDMEQVLIEVGKGWENLNTNQRAAVAVSLAGTRQQSRLIAIMADFDRTLELVNISQESSGATNAQQVEFMRGLEAALVNLQTAYQGFIKNITDSEAIIGIVRTLTFLIESLTKGLDAMGFAGKNAMVVLIALAGVMKSLSVINALLQKQQTAELLTKKLLTAGLVKQTYLQLALNIAKKKEALVTTLNTAAQAKFIGMTKLGTLALIAKTKAMVVLNAVMAVNPFILVAMAIAGVALAIGAAMKNTKQNTTALKEQNEEIQAAQYQFKQLDKSLKSSLEKIEELNKLAFLTPEQEKQLDDAKEKIAELVGEENIIRDSRGTVDLDASETAVKAFLENQKNLVNASIDDAYKNAIDKLKDSNAGMYSSSTTYMGTLDPNNINAIYTKILNEHEKAFGTVSPVVAALYKEKIIDKLSTGEGATSLATNLSDFMETEASNTLNFLQKSIEEIQALEGDLVKQVDKFNEKIDSGNEEQVKLLEKQYASLAALRKEYGAEASEEVAKDLQTAGIADLKNMQKAMSTFGESLPEVLEKIAKRVKDIEEDKRIAPDTALSMAWSEFARTIGDSETALFAYSQAYKKTTLRIAQDLTQLNDKLKVVSETQDKFLKGELSASDIQKFIGDNDELFDSLQKVEDFLSGKDITGDLYSQITASRIDNINSLEQAYYDFYKAQEQDNKGQQQEALQRIAFFQATLQYNGALKQSSIEQQTFNNTLKQYNLLSKLGIDNTKLNSKLLKEQVTFINTAANTANQKILEIGTNFQKTIGKEGLTGTFSDFVKIVNGTAIPVFEKLEGLSQPFYNSLTEAITEIQKELDNVFNAFDDLRKQNLQKEKESLDEQKKVYENYFKALDRLEQERERKLNRKDLVEQLARLEGATDERSRKKALELRTQLNKLDKDSAKASQQETREALLQSFDNRYQELEQKWALAGQQFVQDMSNGGISAADAFKKAIDANGLLPGITTSFDMGDFATILQTFGDTLETTMAAVQQQVIDDKNAPKFFTQDQKNAQMASAMQALAAAGGLSGTQYGKGQFSNTIGPNTLAAQPISVGAQISNWFKGLFGFAEGGLVNFTGLAKLHGSSTSPEAVLNPQQTQMFMGLRDALQGLGFENGNGSTVNIENIEIKTDSLNSNQDFNRAGETLANAFNNAIQRRGLMINTKK